ncbi:MAG TPA: hypothetical protein VK760_15175 [Candidatus Acidoferrales bacterium]|nr:hypothetical protein [Candidatus Acidoferrales bacterium]
MTLMENFVAGIFGSAEPALEAYYASIQLAAQETFQVLSAAVYTHDAEGELAPETPDMGTANDLAFADSGAGQEALDELNAEAPEGSHVVLLHIVESSPSSVDATLRSFGGTVVRRSLAELESAGARRFDDL